MLELGGLWVVHCGSKQVLSAPDKVMVITPKNLSTAKPQDSPGLLKYWQLWQRRNTTNTRSNTIVTCLFTGTTIVITITVSPWPRNEVAQNHINDLLVVSREYNPYITPYIIESFIPH